MSGALNGNPLYSLMWLITSECKSIFIIVITFDYAKIKSIITASFINLYLITNITEVSIKLNITKINVIKFTAGELVRFDIKEDTDESEE